MENHLYQCIYDVLGSTDPPDIKFEKLNKFKAKILRLHATRADHVMLDQVKGDDMPEEQVTLYHLLQHKRRQETRHVSEVCDQQGRVYSGDDIICTSFAEYLSRQYGPINAEPDSI
jgi:hypothetical protein